MYWSWISHTNVKSFTAAIGNKSGWISKYRSLACHSQLDLSFTSPQREITCLAFSAASGIPQAFSKCLLREWLKLSAFLWLLFVLPTFDISVLILPGTDLSFTAWGEGKCFTWECKRHVWKSVQPEKKESEEIYEKPEFFYAKVLS